VTAPPVGQLSPAPGAEPAPRPSLAVPCQLERGLISPVQAETFRIQAAALNLVEINDVGLSKMVCTPHLLPRSLFFKKPCPCSGDKAEPTADELASFRDETEGPADGVDEDEEPARDLRADLADPDLYDSLSAMSTGGDSLSSVSFDTASSPEVAGDLAARVVNIHQDFLANPHYDVDPARFAAP